MARIGVWRVGSIAGPEGRLVFQIYRSGVPVGEPWIFKGQAVREKGLLVKREAMAVREECLSASNFVRGTPPAESGAGGSAGYGFPRAAMSSTAEPVLPPPPPYREPG